MLKTQNILSFHHDADTMPWMLLMARLTQMTKTDKSQKNILISAWVPQTSAVGRKFEKSWLLPLSTVSPGDSKY